MFTSPSEVFSCPCFWAALSAWLLAQIAKMICDLLTTGRLRLKYLVSTGGMPSAHSALVTALAVSVGLEAGFGTPLFVVALVFALVVMFDASTVRRAAGTQAKLLNELIDELFKEHHFSERKLKELLGHTRLEVIMGMIIGGLTAVITNSLFVILA